MSIQTEGDLIRLSNPWLFRELRTNGGLRTVRYDVRPSGSDGPDSWLPTFWPGREHPMEAEVEIDGTAYRAAAHEPDFGFYEEGAWDVTDIRVRATTLGQAVDITCRPRPGLALNLELVISYEIADHFPLLIKQVTVRNTGSAPVSLDNLTVEMLDWTRTFYAKALFVFTDYYEHYETIPKEDDAHRAWMRWRFPAPIHYSLSPGETVESFRCFEYTCPNDEHSRVLTRQRILTALAPWLKNPPIGQEFQSLETLEDLKQAAVQAKERGIEMVHFFIRQIFTNCGDYIPRPDLFPRGEEDLKQLIDHYHAHGVKVVPYCSLTMAWNEHAGENCAQVTRDHEDWQYLGPGGIHYNCYGFGNMCYQSGWGEYISGKLHHLLDLGFDGLHIDAPYHWLPCLAENHHHDTPHSVHFMNWRWEREFLRGLRERGGFFTVPQDPAALLFGANAVPGGYLETDFAAMGGMPLVQAIRSLVHDHRAVLPSVCTWGYFLLDKIHGHAIEASEENPENYEHALASCFGYGHWGLLHGGQLSCGPRTEEILIKWIDLFKTYRDTFQGQMLSLIRPDGKHPDAVLHVNPTAEPPALVVAFNPSPNPAQLHLRLPLGAAGFTAGVSVEIDRMGTLVPDALSACIGSLELAPWEIAVLPVRPKR